MLNTKSFLLFILLAIPLGLLAQHAFKSTSTEFELSDQVNEVLSTYNANWESELKRDYFLSLPKFFKNRNVDSLILEIESLSKDHSKRDPLFLFLLAEGYTAKKEFDQVESYLEEAIDLLESQENVDLDLIVELYLNRIHLEYYRPNTHFKRLELSEKALIFARANHYDRKTLECLAHQKQAYSNLGLTDQAILSLAEARDLSFKIGNLNRYYFNSSELALGFASLGKFKEAISIWNSIEPAVHEHTFNRHFLDSDTSREHYSIVLSRAAETYYLANKLDTALLFIERADQVRNKEEKGGTVRLVMGKVYLALGRYQKAKELFRSESEDKFTARNHLLLIEAQTFLSKSYAQLGRLDSAIYILRNPSQVNQFSYTTRPFSVSKIASEYYTTFANNFESINELDSALLYTKKANQALRKSDSLKAENNVAVTAVKLEVENLEKQNASLQQSADMLDKKHNKAKRANTLIIVSSMFLLLLGIVLFVSRKQKENIRRRLQEEQLANKDRIAIESELNAIRSQMNPHFMFNALNSINDYIQTDKSDEASDYLVKFSRLMRATLNYSKKKFVTLKEEVDILKLYMELENLRFSNSIETDIEVSNMDANKILIPPMIVQPFVENAMWHGLMPKESNRKLSVRFHKNGSGLICEVEDNGIGRAASKSQKVIRPGHKSQGIGLTQRRMELLQNIHGGTAEVNIEDLENDGLASGTRVRILLPFQNPSDS